MMSAGIDAGSSAVKTVIVDQQGTILGSSVVPNKLDYCNAVERSFRSAVEKSCLRTGDIAATVSTGWGRRNVPFAKKSVTEITCHGRGAFHLSQTIRTVIDIGSQDSKIIKVTSTGDVSDFCMNNQCAAGTGAFLEYMAQTLEVPLGSLSGMAEKAEAGALRINAQCTVFARTEILGLMSHRCKKTDIVKAILAAVADKTAAMVRQAGIEHEIMLSGGVALNPVFVEMLQEKLHAPVLVADNPQLVGALGAALIACDSYSAMNV